MDTIKVNNNRTKFIAHMGFSKIERENTCPAFIAAGNRSYYGIETDIQAINDGNFIAMHDDTTGRVCPGGENVNVIETPYKELKEIILPDLDGSFDRTDIRIPTLAEYVKICKKYGKKCILEVKNIFKPEALVRMVEEIKSYDYLEDVIFISIEYENCINLRKILPDAKIQYLTGQKMDDNIIKMLTGINIDAGIDIDYERPERNKERIDLLHSYGIKVNVCVCDDPALAEDLISMGADYITSNILE